MTLSSLRRGAALWTLLLAASAVALAVVPAHAVGWRIALAAVAVGLAVLLWRSVVMPMAAVSRGLELVEAQGFADRLRRVGEGEADRIVNLFNRIIDSLRAERVANQEQASFLTLLLDEAPMGVLVLDFDGRAEMANPAFFHLTDIPSGTSIRGLTPAQLPTPLAEAIAGVARGKSSVITHGDKRMYRCAHLSFVRLGFPQSFYLLESLTDEVRRAERRAYATVIRTLAHEVNNSMGGVRSALDMLGSAVEDTDLREVAESCAERCIGLSQFINSYADVVRVPRPVLVEADLGAAVASLLPFLRGMAPEGVSISVERPAEAVCVRFDAALMQQVIVNIVKNAIESMPPEGGRIELRVDSAEQLPHGQSKTMLTIANNGAPLADEAARNIFRPFFSTKRDGRGLGLTLVAEILERHGANYSLLTDTDGTTRFRIAFAADNASAPASTIGETAGID